jgi:hypothetical protein
MQQWDCIIDENLHHFISYIFLHITALYTVMLRPVTVLGNKDSIGAMVILLGITSS